eukprot:scaffold14196_cov104-Isochrysis_galbana.AAC.4
MGTGHRAGRDGAAPLGKLVAKREPLLGEELLEAGEGAKRGVEQQLRQGRDLKGWRPGRRAGLGVIAGGRWRWAGAVVVQRHRGRGQAPLPARRARRSHLRRAVPPVGAVNQDRRPLDMYQARGVSRGTEDHAQVLEPPRPLELGQRRLAPGAHAGHLLAEGHHEGPERRAHDVDVLNVHEGDPRRRVVRWVLIPLAFDLRLAKRVGVGDGAQQRLVVGRALVGHTDQRLGAARDGRHAKGVLPAEHRQSPPGPEGCGARKRLVRDGPRHHEQPRVRPAQAEALVEPRNAPVRQRVVEPLSVELGLGLVVIVAAAGPAGQHPAISPAATPCRLRRADRHRSRGGRRGGAERVGEAGLRMSPRCPRFDRGRRSSDGGCVERGKDLIVARAPGVVNNRRQPAEGRSAREHPQRRHGSVLEQHLSEDLGVGWLNGRAGALGVLDEAVDGVEGDGYARSAGGRHMRQFVTYNRPDTGGDGTGMPSSLVDAWRAASGSRRAGTGGADSRSPGKSPGGAGCSRGGTALVMAPSGSITSALATGDAFGDGGEPETIDESGSATAVTDAAAGTKSKLPDRLPDVRGSEGDSALGTEFAGTDAWRLGIEEMSSSPKRESGGAGS